VIIIFIFLENATSLYKIRIFKDDTSTSLILAYYILIFNSFVNFQGATISKNISH